VHLLFHNTAISSEYIAPKNSSWSVKNNLKRMLS